TFGVSRRSRVLLEKGETQMKVLAPYCIAVLCPLLPILLVLEPIDGAIKQPAPRRCGAIEADVQEAWRQTRALAEQAQFDRRWRNVVAKARGCGRNMR